MFQRLREDIACIRERDPAARSSWEVLTCYPGLHAIVLHRQAAWWWRHGFHWMGRWLSHLARFVTGIEPFIEHFSLEQRSREVGQDKSRIRFAREEPAAHQRQQTRAVCRSSPVDGEARHHHP